MQRVVIFDGPDGCGKTEMARELSRRLGIPTFKNPRESMFFEDDPGYFTKAMKYGDPVLYEMIKQTGLSVILDRSYPSEWVYSQVFERTTDWRMLRVVDELAASVGALIVVPYRTDYTLTKDDFAAITREKLIRLHGLYEQFCDWTKCRVLRICVDSEDLEREMDEIMPFITVEGR
jgi:thymidylate kinase